MSANMSAELTEVLRQAEKLAPEELLYAIARLAERAQASYRGTRHRQWREICGAAPYPLLGEDAQEWVSRTRREGDEFRERRWRKSP